ncbi:hypothetical protein [Halorarius halobius]|uniref:hypothetical protein n=1 Tax=Halorarius halobius TaxID=2962671 RepID=UPI0020CE87E3|nr:hypothetical protein [Halorarius halobius]
MVVSVIAAPVAAADGDDGISVGDDDSVGVSADNDSVGASAGGDDVSVSDDGVETETAGSLESGDTSDASVGGSTDDVESGSTDDATDGVATTRSDDEELPYNYSDIPLSLIPVDLCRGPPEAPEPPADPTDPPEPVPSPGVPVDPTNPPSPPLSQCDAFDPYDPPFDPTDLPDDPSADYEVYEREVASDGVDVVLGGEASPDSHYPSGGSVIVVGASPDSVTVGQQTVGTDGRKGYIVFTAVNYQPGTKNGSVRVGTLAVGKAAGASLVCDGQACRFSQSAVPADGRTVPTGGGNDSGGGSPLSPEPPAEIPCSPPVGPGDAPEPPADPTDPPEPLPSPPDVPVDPTNPPSPPAGPCDVYDPNDPPSLNPNPGYGYTVYELGPNGTLLGATGTYNESGGPGGAALVGASNEDDRAGVGTYAAGSDGQKPFMTLVNVGVDPNSLTRVGLTGYQLEGGTVVSVDAFGKQTGVAAMCDGEFCYLSQSAVPADDRKVRIATEDADESDGAADTMSEWARDTADDQ